MADPVKNLLFVGIYRLYWEYLEQRFIQLHKQPSEPFLQHICELYWYQLIFKTYSWKFVSLHFTQNSPSLYPMRRFGQPLTRVGMWKCHSA